MHEVELGEFEVNGGLEAEERRFFMKRLLADISALERMIEEGRFEADVRRVGAEQELFLVDRSWQPAPVSLQVLERLDDPRFTTELGLFNLEINIEPLIFGGDCLRTMENSLLADLRKAREAAESIDTRILLTGILPTLQKSHLSLDNMTPRSRYLALNDAIQRLRGGDCQIRIKGIDELLIRHDTVMLEACTTSFQMHFQVTPEEFAPLYNTAQLVTAPLLAASANSALLFGKRLWSETRIALFQQSIDIRRGDLQLREIRPRVSFGKHWVKNSVLEIFREDISRFRVLLAAPGCGEDSENPTEIPQLRALRLHNGTIYRWNRPCYGVREGKPHLRIENRVVPAGPTVRDQIANSAFFFGLMSGVSSQYEDLTRRIDFEHVSRNFAAAARHGLMAQFRWIDGRNWPAKDLICQELLPLARAGLVSRGIDREDVDTYLEVIEKRVESGRNGAQWVLDSMANMKDHGSASQRLSALTSAIHQRQKEEKPVHEWPPAKFQEEGWKSSYLRVEQFMTTDLFTVHQDETIGFVANLMDWQRIRHVPVEDDKNQLVGLVSYRSLMRHFARGSVSHESGQRSVTEIMKPNPVTVAPETSTLDAIKLMTKHNIGCLLVVKDDRLVGIITERDFMRIARKLVERKLQE